uniref:Uncharacterized protein n=1 Tax=Arundo donax TaxID=35708 RepID=A0A0A9DZP2_ARUDO
MKPIRTNTKKEIKEGNNNNNKKAFQSQTSLWMPLKFCIIPGYTVPPS